MEIIKDSDDHEHNNKDELIKANCIDNMNKYEDYYPYLRKICVWSKIMYLPKELEDFFKEESIHPDNAINILKDHNNDLFNRINNLFSDWEALFPKINNKAAKDSEFIVPEMKCLNIEELFVLLKSSSLICREAIKSYENNSNPSLILKKWYPMSSSKEFRVFIKDYCIKGITQRRVNTIYENNDLEEVKKCVYNFLIDIKNNITLEISDKIDVKSESYQDSSNINEKLIGLFKNCYLDIIVYTNSSKIKIFDIEKVNYLDKEFKESTLLLFNLKSILENKGVSVAEYFSNQEKVLKEESNNKYKNIEIRVVEEVTGKSKEELNLELNRFPLELQEYGAKTIEELIKMTELQKLEDENNDIKN